MRIRRRLVALVAVLALSAGLALGGTAARAGTTGTAKDDAYTAYEDHVLTVPAPGVLDNDEGGGSTPCVLSVDDSALDGSVTVDEDGSFVYTPLADYVATDSFDYDMGVETEGVCGGTGSTATVEIDVQTVNDPPTAILDDDCSGGVSVAEDSGAYSSGDHCASVASFGTVEEAGQTVEAWVVSNNNTTLFSVQPSLSVSGFIYGDLHFTPATNAHGSATVSLRARDSGGTSKDGVDLSPAITFTLTITSVNDAPTATADSFIALKDRTLNVGVPGVLLNDGDIDSGSITAVLDATTSHGVLTLAANGSFSYTPAAGYTGPDAFSYHASDGSLSSPTRVVSITVTAIPPVPTPTPLPTPTLPPGVTPEPTLTEPLPTPSIDIGASVEPTESAVASAVPSGAVASAAPSLGPGETPGPTTPADDEGGLSLPVLLVLVLLAVLIGFGAALYLPKWLKARNVEVFRDDEP